METDSSLELKTNRIRFKYIRDENKHPVACLAYKVNYEKQEVQYQFSTWNPKDTFNRKQGRTTAEVRLTRRPLVFSYDNKESKLTDLLKAIQLYLSSRDFVRSFAATDSVRIPNRLRRVLKENFERGNDLVKITEPKEEHHNDIYDGRTNNK